jgi:lipoprotein-anchoring transpeptidase ErfK/SrfK
MSTAMNARKGRLWRRVLAAATLLLLLVIGVGVRAYAVHYSDRALPGTTVGGLPVAGMSRAQVAAAVQQRFDGASVTFRTAGRLARQERLADLGYAIDVDATVDAVLAANRSWSSYVTSLVAPREVHAVLESDRARLDEVATDLVEEAGKVGTAARVRRAQDKESFVAVPAVIGQTVVMASVRDAVEEAGRELASTTAEVQFVVAEPAVTTADAQAVAAEANAMVRHTVMVSDGSIEHAASAARKASWVTIPTAGGVPGEPQVKAAKVQEWVDSLAEDAKEAPRDGLRNVSATGRVLTVVTPARDGRVVSNSADVAEAVSLAMTKTSDYAGKLEYRTIPASWTDRRAAVGAENLAYPAAEGEKWIDVNLSRHTMTAYVGGSVVRGPVAMVNGAPATPTVVGTFHVYRKNPLMTMRGFNADGTRYETPNVPWSSFFHAGYALHGAPWRSSFGYSASHGCVNLPVDVAKWVYGWATVGTPVASHY